MRISEILLARPNTPITIDSTRTLKEAATVLSEHRFGLLPVCDSDSALIGVLSERDIVAAMAKHGQKAAAFTVGDVMTRDVETCQPNDFCADVLDRMNAGRFRHMPVIFKQELHGLISIRDILQKLQEDSAQDRDKLYSAGLSWL